MAEDFPKTLREFERRFGDAEACRQYRVQMRWPDGFRCPRCQGRGAWPAQRGRLVCGDCRYQATATAGTIFQDTRLPLRRWFRALGPVTRQKHGASALGVQRVLGLGRYETAWTWRHKLRRALVRPGRDRWPGRIEVDETYVGGSAEGKRGRGAEGKTLIALAAPEEGPGIGRVRLARVPDASSESLLGFVQASAEAGSPIHTEGWRACQGWAALGCPPEFSVLPDQGPEAATKLRPRVHQIASLLKRWLLGTHQGAGASHQLDYYLDEYTFRFNRQKSASRGKLFCRWVQPAVQVEPAPYRSIVGGAGNEHHKQSGRGGVKGIAR